MTRGILYWGLTFTNYAFISFQLRETELNVLTIYGTF